MQAIVPVNYTVTSTTVSSPDAGQGEVAWNIATSYNIGDTVHRPNSPSVTGEGSLYKAVQFGGDRWYYPSDDPEDQINDVVKPLDYGTTTALTLAWAYLGPSNAYAMFDDAKGSITTDGSGLQVVLEIAADETADSICLDDVTADTVQIEVLDGATVVYDETFELGDDTPVGSWYDFFFDSVITSHSLIVRDLPLIAGASIRVTFDNDGGTGDVSCGTCMPGRKVDFGDTTWECQTSINNYSTKKVNAYSNRSSVLPGPYSQRIDCKVSGATDLIDGVVRELILIRNTPCFWVAAPGQFDSLTAYGYVRDWTQPYSPSRSLLNLTIESLDNA